ncbi:MAG: ribosome small subunit-dependent GTPase A [Polyangiales bacterium]
MPAGRQGLVMRSTAGFVDVLIGEEAVQCRVRGRLKQGRHDTDLCVIGDRVIVQTDEFTHVVTEVLPRQTRFSRRQPGRGADKEDVLIANLQQLLVTFSFGQPLFNARLLDRFLAIAEHQGIDPVIIMNKVDLEQPGNADWQRTYESIGYPIVNVSARSGSGIEPLRKLLGDKISAFVGPSGVGKSSLINEILPALELGVAEVSDHHGKGRHTTRVASLYPLPGRGFLADTPGIRELGTWALPIEELDRCFPEFAHWRTSCAFRSCSHTHEPRCAVIDAANDGRIDRERYESYVRLREDTATRPSSH